VTSPRRRSAAPARKDAFAIAATGCLGERVESGEGAVDNREVEIHARLDELCRNDANRLATRLPLLDLRQHFASVLGTHQRREVDRRGVSEPSVQKFGELARISA